MHASRTCGSVDLAPVQGSDQDCVGNLRSGLRRRSVRRVHHAREGFDAQERQSVR